MSVKIGKLTFHKGSQKWYVRVDGKPKYLTKPRATEAEAELELAKLRISLCGQTAEAKTTDDRPISELVDIHLKTYQKGGSVKNMQDKRRVLTGFAKELGDRTPRTILPFEIEQWLTRVPTRGSGGGKRQYYAHIACFFNWCRKKLKGRETPHIGVDRPEEHLRGEDYVLTDSECGKIRDKLAFIYCALFEVCLDTGARMASIFEATIDQYDPLQHCLHKKASDRGTKGKKIDILLTKRAEALIVAAIGDRKEGLIFLTPDGKPANERWYNECIIRAAKSIGRSAPCSAYSTRHTFAVKHLERGIPIHQVAAWMGNTVAILEKHYGHTLERLRSTRHLLEDDPPAPAVPSDPSPS